MNKFLLLGALLLTAMTAFAQQQGHYSLFMFNQQVNNPAAVGARETGSFLAQHRQQWTGLEGAPVNQTVVFDSPLVKDRVGTGIAFTRHSIGIAENWNARLAYSYKIPLSEKLSVRIGIHGMIQYYGFDFSDDRIVIDEDDDMSIRENLMTREYKGNVGTGLYVDYDNKLFFGVSAPQLYQNDLGVNEISAVTAQEANHIYGYAGALLPLSEKLQFKPNVQVKYVNGAPINGDINLSLIFDNLIMGGVSYRTGGDAFGESVTALAFFQITRQFGIGGAYDYTLSMLNDFNNGSFELIARYDLESTRGDLANPRFFN